MTVQKLHCLHAGTSGPSEAGDGYLYAPLKGARLDVIQAIIRNSSGKPNLPQTTIQLLIWAVLAKTNFENLPTDPKSGRGPVAHAPQQLFELNGGALGLIPGDVLGQGSRLVARIRPGNPHHRETSCGSSFPRPRFSYQAAGSPCVPPNSAANSKTYPSGVWSKHPNGYDVRYFSIQLYENKGAGSMCRIKAVPRQRRLSGCILPPSKPARRS